MYHLTDPRKSTASSHCGHPLPTMPPTKSYSIDGTSLVNPALHHPAIMELLNTELSRPVMGTYILTVTFPHIPTKSLSRTLVLTEHVADRVIEVVDFALGRPSTSARGRLNTRRRCAAAEFIEFAKQVIERAGIRMPGLLGTLVYLDRAKPHLQLSLEEWACERVFLGALICSNKVRHVQRTFICCCCSSKYSLVP